jgi:hypothetical protein
MADNVGYTPGTGATVAADDIAGALHQRIKLTLGADGVSDGDVSSANPMPVSGAVTISGTVTTSGTVTANAGTNLNTSALALETGGNLATAATELVAIDAKIPALNTRVPHNGDPAPPVRLVGQEIWQASFSDVGTTIAAGLTTPFTGTGVSFSQASGNLAIVAGTTANAEFFTRSSLAFEGSLRLRFGVVASTRIINNNLAVMLADLVGEGLSVTINSATSITVTKVAHGFTAANVGQFMQVGRISGANGVPGRYAIASIGSADTFNMTVAGWPASGSCTVTIFGRNYIRNLVTGTTATAINWDTQRNGWAAGDTAATINTTASPGTIIVNEVQSREAYLYDQLRATATAPTLASRASRVENIPDDNAELYLFIWSFNGTTAPASSTTWTLSFVSIEKFANVPVYLQGARAQGTVNPIPVAGAFFQATQPVSLATNTPTLAAGTNRAAFLAGAGIWYDDSSTNLAGGATFTGTARDATVTATATAWANAATYAQEIDIGAESDVTGTLWLEVSRDNTNWRRIKSVATTAVTGGGFYAEIVHRPSWRYWRCGYTNGAGAQARFTIGSIAKAI